MDPLNRLLDPGLLIPVVAILMPMLIVLVALHYAWRYQERKHQTIVGLLEKGLPVPRELLRSPRREGSGLMRALTRFQQHARRPELPVEWRDDGVGDRKSVV